MSRLESVRKLIRRWFTSVLFFILIGLVLGGLVSILVIPKPNIATITISGTILDQTYVDDILDILRLAREDNRIKGVVLRINSPGGGVSATEQIYLDLLRLRQQKPVVVSVGAIAASGGYYAAVASNFIYAEPTSQIGGVGAWVNIPGLEELDEDVGSSGPFKVTGGSRRKALGNLEIIRQGFVEAVKSQRGDRLKLSDEELSRAELYVGVEGLRHGLIDEIGTRTAAVERVASLAGIRNYDIIELSIPEPTLFWYFSSSDLADLKSQTNLEPVYYYLYFAQE